MSEKQFGKSFSTYDYKSGRGRCAPSVTFKCEPCYDCDLCLDFVSVDHNVAFEIINQNMRCLIELLLIQVRMNYAICYRLRERTSRD